MTDGFLPGLEAIGAMMAGAEENLNLLSISKRQPKLCDRLLKFDPVRVISILSGLLTQKDSHSATFRIEALIHLALIHCRGTQKPTLVQVREWLNVIILKDRIGRGEVPPEDVFTSVVPSFTGCATLFEGAWKDNAYYLQNMMAALLRHRGKAWADTALRHVMSLLCLANEVARRASVGRYEMSTTGPGQVVKVAPRNVEVGSHAVNFSLQEIFQLHLVARDLTPFVLGVEDIASIGSETLGNTKLERRPIYRHADGWLVAVPTAIGAAARRFCMESANSASALSAFQASLHQVELQDVTVLMMRNWETKNAAAPIELGPRLTAITAEFDIGAFALVVLTAADMSEALRTGLQGTDTIGAEMGDAVAAMEAELSSRPDYRRGLTIVVHGGVGRGFALGFADSPAGWHRLGVDIGDAMRMGWDGDFTAKRVWKILSQQEKLAEREFVIANTGGFINLYGCLQSQSFEPVQSDLSPPGMAMLASDFAGHARARIRKAIDYHLVPGPDATSLIEVQRRSTSSFFKEVRDLPLYVAPAEAIHGRLLAVVETQDRPWWVDHPAGVSDSRGFTRRIWDAAQRWLVRLAPILEGELPLTPRVPVCVRLEFPDITELSDLSLLGRAPVGRPDVRLDAGVICVVSPLRVLSGYADATNVAERYLISAIALGACELAGAKRTVEWADALAIEITGSDEARFVHAIPAGDVTEMVQAAIDLPAPRFVMDEDRGWSLLGLAALSGRSQPGDVPPDEVGKLLQTAVLRVWERIRGLLVGIDRRSIVMKALLNQEAIDKDRAEWAHTAAALLALHRDKQDILRTQNEIEGRRAIVGVASRALAEMAICTSPTTGSEPCSDIDFDTLIAEVCTMLDCASQCDAHFYDLAVAPLRVVPNGNFRFDHEFAEQLHVPYMYAHGDRAFGDAAASYADAFPGQSADDAQVPAPDIDPALEQAIHAEFGLELEHLVAFSQRVGEMALERHKPFVSLTRSELLALIAGLGTDIDADRAYAALTLVPRPEWNEPKPKGALARDWQPWRMSRKLSLTRRPLIQMDLSDDPEVMMFPVLTARVVRRIFELIEGRLSSEMFDTKEVDRWIGKIVNDRGHAFNHSVAQGMCKLGYEALPDQLMTKFGARKELGDIDVLAWDRRSGIIWIVECKRLLMDRTVGEIGERLADYTKRGKRNGKRTLIQKHLDRVDFVNANKSNLTTLTGIQASNMSIRSALVTDQIVPMQFGKTMKTLVDLACDYRKLEAEFGRV